jgi:Arc/MetJ family transcription regulator
MAIYTSRMGWQMRTNIEIDDRLMADAQKVAGRATKKQTVEEALRLLVRVGRQRDVGAAFGKFRWRGNLGQSRKGRRTA